VVVYLIHFQIPYRRARHYMGVTSDLAQRLEDHRRGAGSALMAAVTKAGIEWEVVRTWPGDRKLERRMKRWKNSPRLCPVCRGEGRK
jgi:predicted GIY-YIG superfamily endonuclease